MLCSLLCRVSCLYNPNAFKTKGFVFYMGKIRACKCPHTLVFAAEIQLHPEPCTAPAFPPNTWSPTSIPAHTISSTTWNFPRIWLYWHGPNMDSASPISDQALMHLKDSSILVQGKALYQNRDVLGAAVAHRWFSAHPEMPSVCRSLQTHTALPEDGTKATTAGGGRSSSGLTRTNTIQHFLSA